MGRSGPRKYAALTAYLAGQPPAAATVALPLGELERIVGTPLVSAAWTRSFWVNTRTVARCRSWLTAGWYVARFDRLAGVVTFARADSTG
jgi:hypothetical protein